MKGVTNTKFLLLEELISLLNYLDIYWRDVSWSGQTLPQALPGRPYFELNCQAGGRRGGGPCPCGGKAPCSPSCPSGYPWDTGKAASESPPNPIWWLPPVVAVAVNRPNVHSLTRFILFGEKRVRILHLLVLAVPQSNHCLGEVFHNLTKIPNHPRWM